MSDWNPNQIIQGRYRLKSLLGRGGMGSVWVALHEQLQSEVAVKRLDPSIASNEEALGRFNREAQALATLRSPNVVQVFDYGVDEGVAFIAMELLRGESLGDRIQRLGRLTIEDTVRFLGEVLRAIGKAHAAGIIHRDLKPDNIFICEDEPEFAKVLDFGVAKISSASQPGMSSQTRTGAVIGTPFYMSPEQARGQGIDARTDLWAMGIIAFECLTGQLPFEGESFGDILVAICTGTPRIPSQLASVPAGFDAWTSRAINRDRDARFQSAREMWTELAKLAGAPLTAESRPVAIGTGVSNVSGVVSEETMQVLPGFTTAQRAATYSTINRESALSDRNRRNLVGLAVALVSILSLLGGGFAWFKVNQSKAALSPSVLASALASSSIPSANSTADAPIPTNSVAPAATSVSAIPVAAGITTAVPTVSPNGATVAVPKKAATSNRIPVKQIQKAAPAEKPEGGRELLRSFSR